MKVLPGGWSEKRLDQWGAIVSGSTPSTIVPDFWDGDIVWVTPADLSKLSTPYLFDSAKRLTSVGLSSCSARLMPVGSVVLSSRAPIGYVALPRIPFCTNQGCKSLVLNEGVNSEFAYYSLIFNVDELKNRGEGTTFAEISKAALATVTLPLPTDTREQAKIGEILAATDRAIERTKASLSKQESIKSGLMIDLLARGVDENGNIRSERTHEFKDSALGRIPAEWQVVSLREISEGVTSGSRGWARYYADEGAVFLRIGNLMRDGISLRLEDVVRVAPSSSAEGKRTSVQCGDILISITADLGLVGVIPDNFEEAYVNQHIALVRLRASRANARFIGWFLSGHRGQTQFETLNESGAKAGLNLPTVGRLLVPMPCVSEQARIAEQLDAMTQGLVEEKASLAKLRSVKSALMRDLLEGRKRVTPLLEASDVEKVA